MKWLMLRGELDDNNLQNIKDRTDMWIELFEGLVGDGQGIVWFWTKGKHYVEKYSENIVITTTVPKESLPEMDYVFARGAHPQYTPILKECKKAFKIRYAAGRRTFAKEKIKFDLWLVDCEEDLAKGKEKGLPVALYIKPAASCFKPISMTKQFDVIFVANGTQKFKGHQFVRKHAPKHLKILHCGFPSEVDKLPNVTQRRVQRSEMPKYYNMAKVSIVCTDERDSCPRVIPESIACGLPVIVLDRVRFWKERYKNMFIENFVMPPGPNRSIYYTSDLESATKEAFWTKVCDAIEDYEYEEDKSAYQYIPKNIRAFYNKRLSLPVAVEHLKGLINGRQTA